MISSLGIALAGCAGPAARPESAASAIFQLALGEHHRSGSITITPSALVEDSRCPKAVQCIWAGRVRVRATVDRAGRPVVLTVGIGEPGDAGGVWLHLLDACPYPAEAAHAGDASNYRFVFALLSGADASGLQRSCSSPSTTH